MGSLIDIYELNFCRIFQNCKRLMGHVGDFKGLQEKHDLMKEVSKSQVEYEREGERERER